MTPVPSKTLNNGTRMPMLGLGTWMAQPTEPNAVSEAVKNAIDLGYRHLDCAFAYQNENEVGAAVREKIAEGVVKREDLYIVTKLWNTFHRPDLVEPALRQSLEKFGLDYVDLYLMHMPIGHKEGDSLFPGVDETTGKWLASEVDFVDTYKAMEELVKKGLTKSIGVSNFNRSQIERILQECSIPPVTNQVELHPYLSQAKLTDFCQSKNITITAFSTFGNPASPFRKDDDPLPLNDPVIEALAKKHKTTSGQIILRWLFQRDILTIPKSVSKARLAANIDIFQLALDAADMMSMNNLNRNHRISRMEFSENHKYYPFHDEY